MDRHPLLATCLAYGSSQLISSRVPFQHRTFYISYALGVSYFIRILTYTTFYISNACTENVLFQKDFARFYLISIRKSYFFF